MNGMEQSEEYLNNWFCCNFYKVFGLALLDVLCLRFYTLFEVSLYTLFMFSSAQYWILASFQDLVIFSSKMRLKRKGGEEKIIFLIFHWNLSGHWPTLFSWISWQIKVDWWNNFYRYLSGSEIKLREYNLKETGTNLSLGLCHLGVV